MALTEEEEYAALKSKPASIPSIKEPEQEVVQEIDFAPIDWEKAAPELRDRLYNLAKLSDDPKVVLPVFLAIAKMFPDNQVENRAPDIREVMKLLTDEQLTILEKQCSK